MMYVDHVEETDDPDVVIAYSGYGTANQYAQRIERRMICMVPPSTAFLDLD